MEDFKKLKENKNIEEIRVFLKNNRVDLLKTIGKRYKIPASTTKKELIIKQIIKAIEEDRPFEQEPSLEKMTKSQLKTKAEQLHIDISSLTLKQDIITAILTKMKKSSSTTPTTSTSTTTTPDDDIKDFIKKLQSKSETQLKLIAKKNKIKVSKMGVSKLIGAISQLYALGKQPIIDIALEDDIKKMSKDALILKATNIGLTNIKGKNKTELIKLIKQKESGGEVAVEIEKEEVEKPSKKEKIIPIPIISTVPISKELEKELVNHKKVTIKIIKDLLKKFKIDIPKKLTKRTDLIHLLTTVKPSTIITPPPPPPPSVEKESVVKPTKKKPSLTIETDIVSLEDIQTPFSPVPIQDLLDEPSEKQIQDELYRCLQFYEYPK